MSSDDKLFPSRVFTRVRPFTKEEASIAPVDCPIAREVIQWDKGKCLTVLDHTNSFKPKKGGKFRVDSVLWSFEDEEVMEIKPVLQEETYKRVVKPVLSQIVEGYSTAFLVGGAASSGRVYTLYGDGPDGPGRGLIFRFAENIFNEIEKEKEPESILTCEMEAIDMVGDSSFIDCLAPGGGSNSASKKSGGGMGSPSHAATPGSPTAAGELKLTATPDGTKLQGATTVEISGAKALRTQLVKLFNSVRKHNTTHTVSLKFSETFEFEDPESEAGARIRKSRRFRVLFVLLRNLPAAFARCLQVAVDHDTGESPMATVPVRETALTRLYPDLLRQGFALNVVSCVSPFFEHSKDSVNTLDFTTKVMQLVGKPKKKEDARLPEMRRLMVEVKTLKTEVRKQNDAMEVVQQELNAREIELMKQEGASAKAQENLALAKEDLQISIIGRNYQVDKSRRARKAMQKLLDNEKKAIKALQNEADNFEKENKESLSHVKEINRKRDATLAVIDKESLLAAEYQSLSHALEEEEEQVKKLEDFAGLPREEQKKKLKEELNARESSQEELTTILNSLKTQLAEEELEYKKVVEKEKQANQNSPEELKKEIDAIDAKIQNLEALNQSKSAEKNGGCCLVM